MAAGHVYVLVNQAMPDLVKVGKTTLAPHNRATSLSGATGVPAAFDVFKSYSVSDCDAAENHAHDILASSVGRPNKGREFFHGPVELVCEILDDALASYLDRDAKTLNGFTEALRRTGKREFTFACLEFEGLLDRSPDAYRQSDGLIRMLGTYFACCATIWRTPKFSHCISDRSLKDRVMKHAIDVMAGWEKDPAEKIITFFRELS